METLIFLLLFGGGFLIGWSIGVARDRRRRRRLDEQRRHHWRPPARLTIADEDTHLDARIAALRGER